MIWIGKIFSGQNIIIASYSNVVFSFKVPLISLKICFEKDTLRSLHLFFKQRKQCCTHNLFSRGSLNHAADYCGLCWLHCPREMALKCGRVAIDPNHRICCVSSSSERQRGGFLCKSLLILAQSFKIRSMDCQSRRKVEKINISRKMTLSIWASS